MLSSPLLPTECGCDCKESTYAAGSEQPRPDDDDDDDVDDDVYKF